MGTTADKLNYLMDTKTAIKEALVAKGVSVANTDTFRSYADKIAAIPQEGGGATTQPSAGAVNFRDYDGTVLHAYSKDEFLALTAMPALPIQPKLTCQGWNYTLEDAQAYVEEYGVLEVGATYITDDGKTRLYITIAADGRMDVPLAIQQTVSNGIIVDWGDGSTMETFSGQYINTTHHYNEPGDYIISFEVSSGELIMKGSSSSCILGSTSSRVYPNMLQKVEIGKGVATIGLYAFRFCHSLSSVVIPDSVTSIGNSAFYSCYSLPSVVIPNGVTSIGSNAFDLCYSLSSVVIPNGVTSIKSNTFLKCYSLSSVVIPNSVTSIEGSAFNSCYSLSSVVIPNSVTSIGGSAFYSCIPLPSVVIPNGVTSIGSNAFYGCYSLSSVVIPNSVTSIEGSAFYSCYSLSSVVIPNSVTSIEGSAFYSCYSLSSVVIPNSVTSIGNRAFYSCTGAAVYDFRDHISVPTLANTNAFSGIPSDCKIIVPDALYDSWIAASNWSTYASQIIKASEYNE